MSSPIIHILSQQVINKIAAGEIVQRPYSVVKEVLENSLDAKASVIIIYLNGAGLDLIKIVDDGFGISKHDYPLLCERYATSKISSVDDLSHLTSFGFRGEALASISFVSDLIVTSKQRESEIGCFGRFRNGKLFSLDNQDLIQSIGCNDGYFILSIKNILRTIIQVEGLFYNLTNRKTQINKLEEKKQVLKLVQSMAIHHENVIFKLYFDKNCEFNNSTHPSRKEIMAQILRVPSESFTDFTYTEEYYDLTCNLIFSKGGVVKAKKDLILYVNNRLVECETIKKLIENVYSTYYASINDNLGGFFVYCSLNLKPDHVDHNVAINIIIKEQIHPNKKEVRFINEVEISNDLSSRLKKLLQDESNTKKYSQKQSQLPNSQMISEELTQTNKSTQQRQIIRADPQLTTLDSFVQKFKISKQSEEIQEQSQKIKDYKEPNSEIQLNDIELENEQVKQKCITMLTEKIHPFSQDAMKGLVYIGSFTAGSIFVQLKTKLLLLNSTSILFCFFLNKLIQSSNAIQQVYEVSLENYEFLIKLNDILRTLGINIKDAEKIIQFTSYLGEMFKEEDIKIIVNQIQSIQEELESQSDASKVFKVAKIIAEALAFAYVGQWVSEKQIFSNVGDTQLQTLYSTAEREKVDFSYKNEIFPYLKQKASILNLQLDNYSKEILKLENIYSVFERC